MRWLRTPYRHCANVLGAGVDCAMLLVEVFKAVGYLDPTFDPRPYSPNWYLHRSEERYLGSLGLCAERIAVHDTLPGDVAVYRFGRTASHGTIIIDDQLLIHANRESRCVELRERSSIADRLDSCWTLF